MQHVVLLPLMLLVIYGRLDTTAEGLSCQAISRGALSSPEATCYTLTSSHDCQSASECHSESNACPESENIYRPALETFPNNNSSVGSCPANGDCLAEHYSRFYIVPEVALAFAPVDTYYYNITVTWKYADNQEVPPGAVFRLVLVSPETLAKYCVCIDGTKNITSHSVVVKYGNKRNFVRASLRTYPHPLLASSTSVYYIENETESYDYPTNCSDTRHGFDYNSTSCAIPFYARPRNIKVVANRTDQTSISWDPPCYRDTDACSMINQYPDALRPAPDTYYLTALVDKLTHRFIIRHTSEIVLSSVNITDFKLYTQTPCSDQCVDNSFLYGCSQPATLNDTDNTDTCCEPDLTTSIPLPTTIPTVTPSIVTNERDPAPLIGTLIAVFLLAVGLLTGLIIIAVLYRGSRNGRLTGETPPPPPTIVSQRSALVVFSPRTNKEDTFTILQSLCADLSLFDVEVSAYGNDYLRLSPTDWIVAHRSRANAVLCVCNQEFYEDWTETAPYVNDAPRIVQTLKQLFEGDLHLGSEGVRQYAVIKMRTTDEEFIPPLLLSRPSYMYHQIKDIAHFAHNEPIAKLVLCALVNALVPMTFPTEVLVNDRWTINLALETFSDVMCIQSQIDSEDLHEGTKESSVALLTYVLMSGFQFLQATAVVKRMEVLHKQEIGSNCSDSPQTKVALDKIHEEMDWIQKTYDHDRCKEWSEHALTVQAKVRQKIDAMIHSRFCQVVVPRPMTINTLITNLVINLGLTGGVGFFLAESKETLWPCRRLVVLNKKTGEYYEDFSGYNNNEGESVREMLGLHPYEMEEVNPTQHPDYLLFLESTSRNRILKANSSFLYQVFPGTTAQCTRQLLRAARTGEHDTVQKLLVFFKRNKEFVNGTDRETGNTALHVASRHGHQAVMQTLLEGGAAVDSLNKAGSTPFFLATEGLHRTASLLLLEWGANISIKNRISKTALELTRNADLKQFLHRKNIEYQELRQAVRKGDYTAVLEKHVDGHLEGTDIMANLSSRCVRGGTLLHAAASASSHSTVKKLLSKQVSPNIQDNHGATPLHFTRDSLIMKELVEHGGNVISTDDRGNSPLHQLCSERRSTIDSLLDCISLLVGHGASLSLENNRGHLPIHCAALSGLTEVLDSLISCGIETGLDENELHQLLNESSSPSLPCLALSEDHLPCSQWLVKKGFLFKAEELDELLIRLLQRDHSIVKFQLKEAVAFVVERGADVNFLWQEENRPLHLAASLTDTPELTEVLLTAGADPNPTNSVSATPLVIACQKNNLFSAHILLSRGGRMDVRDFTGRLAFEYISDFGEWIQSGLFSPDTVTQLKVFRLRQGKQLVTRISKSPPPLDSSNNFYPSF